MIKEKTRPVKGPGGKEESSGAFFRTALPRSEEQESERRRDEKECEENGDGFLCRIHHGENSALIFRGDGNENDGDTEPDKCESEPLPKHLVADEEEEGGDDEEGEGKYYKWIYYRLP